ncbi:hybrid sensor histidine kinase/response regulator, partial [Oceanidesulfovibrio indonesiensis]
GKDAVCEIEGGEIAVDRRILEMLNDPLMHALRNALDHGIESPSERTAAGKYGHGVVRLRIERQGAGQVRIEISDDGRGIDVDELRNTAVNAGILDAESAEELSRE